MEAESSLLRRHQGPTGKSDEVKISFRLSAHAEMVYFILFAAYPLSALSFFVYPTSIVLSLASGLSLQERTSEDSYALLAPASVPVMNALLLPVYQNQKKWLGISPSMFARDVRTGMIADTLIGSIFTSDPGCTRREAGICSLLSHSISPA